MFKKAFNILGFQLAWWSCVLGIQNGYSYFGPIIMAVFLSVHLIFFKLNGSEIVFIGAVGIIGAMVDTAFLQLSFIEYRGLTVPYFAPLWIIAMWLGFAATLNHSLSWLADRWLFAVLLGAIFGPLSYLAGTKFGALNFTPTFFSITVLVVIWGVAIPLLYLLNQKMVLAK